MGTDERELGAAVAGHVRSLREARGLSVRQLSARLGELGHPLLPSGVSKVENGQRRVDVEDLVALALALNVSPVRLLFPADGTQEVALTGAQRCTAEEAWLWAQGLEPMSSDSAPYFAEVGGAPSRIPATTAEANEHLRALLHEALAQLERAVGVGQEAVTALAHQQAGTTSTGGNRGKRRA